MPTKGVDLLLDALRDVGARAVIVGFGESRQELEAQAPPGTLFTGALEHRHLVHLLALCDVAVVPSIFPEAFGMVAAEAAATGCPPVVARHSGLAEIAAGLEESYGRSAPTWPASARAMRETCREAPRAACAAAGGAPRARRGSAAPVVERWSWQSVARRLLEPFA